MDKKQNMIPLQELNLTSRFLFDEVVEDPQVHRAMLEDGAARIFLNTRGENENEVPKELVEFLHYLENTSDEMAEETNSPRIKRIHDRVRMVRLSEEVGVKYMQAWEERYYEREEAKEEGRKEGLRELIIKIYEKGKTVEEIADMLDESVDEIKKLLTEVTNLD